MNETQANYEIDLSRLLRALLKKWWALLLPALVAALIALLYTTELVTPLYSSTSYMYINASTSSTINHSELQTARDLVDSYEYLIKDLPQTLNEVAKKAGVDYNYQQLRKMVSVSGGGSSTEFIQITVTSPDPEEACLIANTITEVVPGRAAAINMDSTITLANSATIAEQPSSPNLSKNIAVGFLIGMMLGMAFVAMREILDDRVKSEDWLENCFKDDIPLLAIIPSAARTRLSRSETCSVSRDNDSIGR